MPMDPETGLWSPGTPSANQGPLGGVLQILNAPRAQYLADTTDQRRQLENQLLQTKASEEQNNYQQQLGYQEAMGGLGPDSSSDDITRAGLPYSQRPGPGGFATAVSQQARQTTAEGALLRGQGAANRGIADLSKAGTAARAQIAAMGLSNADSIPMLRAAGQITPEVEKMMLQNPSATYSEAVQQKMEEENAKAKESEAKAAYTQARADLAPKLAQHLNALRDAQASLASAKSAMGTKSPAAGKLFQQAQSKYITVTKSIAALNIQLGDQMKMMDAPHKQAAQDELKNLTDQQQALSAQMDELKASAQTPGASANTASVGSTPAGTVSTVQALQALLPTKPQAPQQAQPVQ